MAESVNITFTPLRISGSVPMGTTVLNAARMLGIAMEGPCNGAGTCGKDLVQIRKDGALETVLACKTLLEEDTEVIVPSHNVNATKIVEDFYTDTRRQYPLNQSVRKIVDEENGKLYTTVLIDGQPVAREEGDTSASFYGMAIDIGTTTIVASLSDLKTGSVIGRSSTLNPLVYYGHDVMSRIKFSVSGNGGLLRMHREMISAINLLTEIMSSDCGVDKAAIRSGVELLLADGGIVRDRVKNVVIAGGFGYHLNRESLVTVGLIPDFPNAKFSFVGNSSLEGARMGLLNNEVLETATVMARGTKVLELANVDGFEKRFVREMNFGGKK